MQTLSAVDRDEPEEGQHFLFSLSSEAGGGRLSFALRDNQGKSPPAAPPGDASADGADGADGADIWASSADNTASVLTRRGGLLQRDQLVHFLPVVVADGGRPSLSSTITFSISVCRCDAAGEPRSCHQGAPAPLLLSLQPALLTCILTLTGKRRS